MAFSLTLPLMAQAQTPPPSRETDVVVTGSRAMPSSWWEAETQHVVVVSNGSRRELIRIARNLEREFFLLSVLLNRVDTVDDTIKLRVTLIGDAAEFEAMDLRNLRWQQGPYNQAFHISRYYDPREDGAVMANTRVDQKAVLERGIPLDQVLLRISQPGGAQMDGQMPGQSLSAVGGSLFGLASQADLIPPSNERAFAMPADGLLQAGFAQHYLQTFFPAAYPRWYLDGFGQIFATMTARGDNLVEYGRAPVGSWSVVKKFGSYSLLDVLDGRYLEQSPKRTKWTPVHAWMVTHFLFFSPSRNGQFRQYLQAIATGTPPDVAAQTFGDLTVLARELKKYYSARKPFEQMTFPADRVAAPVLRQMTRGQAAFIKGRLELGSRVEIPPVPAPDADPAMAADMTKARDTLLRERERWLARLRDDAARFGGDPDAQALLAEAECRTGHPANCMAAADRVLALDPANGAALTWKGVAMARAATAGPAEARAAGLRTARATIGRANRADTDAVLPLIAYHRSFAEANEVAPAIALDGLAKALEAVPGAPTTRLALGTTLAAREMDDLARSTLRPVAVGAYDSPEREPARAALARLADR